MAIAQSIYVPKGSELLVHSNNEFKEPIYATTPPFNPNDKYTFMMNDGDQFLIRTYAGQAYGLSKIDLSFIRIDNRTIYTTSDPINSINEYKKIESYFNVKVLNTILNKLIGRDSLIKPIPRSPITRIVFIDAKNEMTGSDQMGLINARKLGTYYRCHHYLDGDVEATAIPHKEVGVAIESLYLHCDDNDKFCIASECIIYIPENTASLIVISTLECREAIKKLLIPDVKLTPQTTGVAWAKIPHLEKFSFIDHLVKP